jgi:hypothetical protein
MLETEPYECCSPYYEVHGVQTTLKQNELSEEAMAAPFLEGDYGGPVQRFSLGTESKTSKLIQFGRAFQDGAGIVPNEEFASRVLIHIPKEWTDVQSVRFIIDIAVVREDQVALPTEASGGPNKVSGLICEESNPNGPPTKVDCSEVQTEWPVEQLSYFERIVRHPRCVLTGFSVHANPRLDVHGGIPEFPLNYAFVAEEACGSPRWRRDDSQPQFWTSTVAEHSLWEKPEPSSEDGKDAKDGKS